MSITYISYAFIGVEINLRSLWVNSQVRSCKHPENTAGVKFCPVCGKPAFQQHQEPIEGFDGEDNLCGLRIVHTSDGYGTWLKAFACVFVLSSDERDTSGFCPVRETMDDLRHRLRSVLQPLGLWREDRFGLYTVSYLS
jgi:hypothetical protein